MAAPRDPPFRGLAVRGLRRVVALEPQRLAPVGWQAVAFGPRPRDAGAVHLPEQRLEAARELDADVTAARSELVILRWAGGLPAAFVFVATPVNLSTPDRLARLQADLGPLPSMRGRLSVWVSRCAGEPTGALEDEAGER